jgi:NAD(P)-dependent dehydrogenase (short-subunit alcohol dehydrogenase family)
MASNERPLAGKVCVVTGATAGIGRETALRLGARGAEVVAVGRSRQRGDAVVEAIGRGGGSGVFFAADLASQAEVRRLASEILARCPKIDVLVNNAGAMFGHRQLSADGVEMTFALNHLAYFLLTQELLPGLRAAGAARIVNVASNAHHGVDLDFDNLEGERDYRGWRAYKRSKLANVYFTYELARRLDGTGVTANALHPGFVATDIGVSGGWTSRLAWRVLTLAAIPVAAGAETSVHLAAAPEVGAMNGCYFVKSVPARSSSASRDEAAARRLWDVSRDRTGRSAGI